MEYIVALLAKEGESKKTHRIPPAWRVLPKKRLGAIMVTVPIYHPLASDVSGTKQSKEFTDSKNRTCRRVSWPSVTDRMEVTSRI